jgi:DNA processing protein
VASELMQEAIAVACLRFGSDTKAARLLKEWAGSAPGPEGCLELLADRLALPADERPRRISLARHRARRILEAADRLQFTTLAWFDPAYPSWLREIVDPPVVLWVKGDVTCLGRPAVAIVGSRRATPAGLAVATRLGRELGEAGLVVVSGMARGIDAAAHAGSLEAGGPTVAVLGSGVDVTYPPEHRTLADRICANGALASEFPSGTQPLARHFPMRNRIISGLARAVVVVEASQKSGSLITARLALEQGRDVLAVPGSIASGRYRGCHALIKDGARLVETVEDVLDEIRWRPPPRLGDGHSDNSHRMSELEAIMAAGEPYTVDDLAGRSGRDVPGLLAELATLEIAGRVARAPGGGFVRLDESGIGGRGAVRPFRGTGGLGG